MEYKKWIDSLKGYSIFCVTLGHLGINMLIEKYIYSFHMFLFFFLSGYLFKHNISFNKFISNKIKNIFTPFIFWNILSCLIIFLNNKSITSCISYLFLLDGEVCWNAPIWFLLMLFMVQIVYYVIVKLLKAQYMYVMIVTLLLSVLVSSNNIFLKLNILPVCLFFYALGDFYCYKEDFFEKIFSKNHFVVMMF